MNGKRESEQQLGNPLVTDPTYLTTQALLREIGGLRELLEQRTDSLQETIKQQFDLVERQRVEQKKDTKDAVDAALTAQKEAVREQTAASEKAITKSETAINRLVEQLRTAFDAAVASLRRDLDEVKGRVAAMEQQKIGAKADRTGLYAGLAAIGGLVILAIAVFGFLAAR